MKALLLAMSLVVTLGASCTDAVTQEDPPPSRTSSPSATADVPSSGVSDSPEPAIDLAGTSWVLTTLDGGDWPVGNDPDVTLAFDDTRLTWSAGCNLFNARWKLVDGHLDLGRTATILSTLVKCVGKVERVERRLNHILSASPAIGNGGVAELRLDSDDGVLVFSSDTSYSR